MQTILTIYLLATLLNPQQITWDITVAVNRDSAATIELLHMIAETERTHPDRYFIKWEALKNAYDGCIGAIYYHLRGNRHVHIKESQEGFMVADDGVHFPTWAKTCDRKFCGGQGVGVRYSRELLKRAHGRYEIKTIGELNVTEVVWSEQLIERSA